ncbi:MAG: hypothetical protein H0W84_10740 [Bacteroidetes bacterium]|nr:hypothetical protein [Bacteroidota bacterium]
MKKILLLSILTLSVISLTLNSCKKDKPDTETQSTVDNNICESEFTKILPNVNSIATRQNGIRTTVCPTVFVDPLDTLNGFPVTMTIDYGTACTDSIDGKLRKGKIICVFSSKWSSIGSSIKVNLVNYSVNNISYSADSIKISRTAATSFTNVVYDGKCSSSSFNLLWKGTFTLSQTAGSATLYPYDDVFEVSGSANGKNRNNLDYTTTISSPLVKRSSCGWIESGKLVLTPSGMEPRTVNFGNGNCDNQALLTIKDNTFTFTMN